MDRINDIELINGDVAIIFDNDEFKALKSNKYNFLFNKKDGFFVRWGKGDYTNLVKGFSITELSIYRVWCDIWGEKFNFYEFITDLSTDGDEMISIPEIVDIEIDTVCRQGCSFCYKSNTVNGEYMTLETYKTILSKLPLSITQVAFGITDINSNPDMWDIFEYTRSMGIIPNVTINGSNMSSDMYDKLSNIMGAVAVSVGPSYDKDNSYNTINELSNRGMKQINIHNMICLENFDYTIQIIKDCKEDERLKKLNSLVFLSLKSKGRAVNIYHPLSQEYFNKICKLSLNGNISIGFDSCSSHKFFKYLETDTLISTEYKNILKQCVEPCESSCYSAYIDVKGIFYPCSFTPNTVNWKDGLDVLNCNNFIDDIWNNKKTVEFRTKLIKCNRECILYKI